MRRRYTGKVIDISHGIATIYMGGITLFEAGDLVGYIDYSENKPRYLGTVMDADPDDIVLHVLIPRGREQVAIGTSDIKREVLEYASKIGLISFPQACMANLYTHGGVCWRMVEQDIVKGNPPPIDYSAVKRLAGEPGVALEGKPVYRRGTLFVRVHGEGDSILVFTEIVKYSFKVCVRKARSR